MRSSQLNNRIYLKESHSSNLFEMIHKFVENFVFFRWIFFKNRPRSTSLLFRSFLITTTFCGLYYLTISNFNFLILGVDVDPILLFGFMGVMGYWSMLKSFYEKNNYCSNMYNDVIKELARDHKKSGSILSLNLSAQLLAMDLWAHRVYSPNFVQNLEQAIEFCYSAENKSYFKPDYEDMKTCINAANTGSLEIHTARNILLAYQYSLEDGL